MARERDGAIINADSMQVYADLCLLTARPSAEEEEAVPHHLYGHVAGQTAYSAARYAEDAARAFATIRAEGRLPIIVGGTGLYFKTLLEGLSPIPPIPVEIRTRLRAEAGHVGPAELHRRLASLDPEMAQTLRPTDPQRIVRALEVLEATGRSLARWQEIKGTPVLIDDNLEKIVVAPDRDTSRARCDARFDAMMAAGALDEVRALLAQNLDPDLPVMRALGVRPLGRHLAGEMTLEAAIAEAKAETRQYVKRQMTWLKGNMSAWKWQFAQ